jgi:transposase-like protein
VNASRVALVLLGASLWCRPARSEPLVVERTAVRFIAPETGGAQSPRFIFERTLSFEARLEALADPDQDSAAPYRERHVRAALERHVAETLLASLHIDPEPTAEDLDRQTRSARLMLLARVGGPAALAQAARAEGIGDRELLGVIRRQARASLYLDRMVMPMLAPSDAELRAVQRAAPHELRARPFGEIAADLRHWYVSRRLAAALNSFYQNARARLVLTILD